MIELCISENVKNESTSAIEEPKTNLRKIFGKPSKSVYSSTVQESNVGLTSKSLHNGIGVKKN